MTVPPNAPGAPGHSAGSTPGAPGHSAGSTPGDPDAQVFVISVAAQLAGMHAQTLRTYDRLGLVTPQRTTGGGRRYSPRDVALLREVQRLSQDEGVNLAGIKRIIELTNQVEALQARLTELAQELANVHAGYRRDLVPVQRNALVVWKPRHQR